MKITKIELQKQNKKRASVFLDGEFSFGANIETIYDYALRCSDEIDEKLKDEILKKDAEKDARNIALNLVAHHPFLEKELERKLSLKGCSPASIQSAVAFLKNYGYIDDQNYIKEYIRQKSRLYGEGRIRSNLISKGASKDLVERTLKENYHSDLEYEKAKKWAEKKLHSYNKDSFDSKYRKLYAFLIRKGVSYEISSCVVKELLSSC
ncbi:regulatory protein [Acetitomaculum ruminis DSM 5522]|uniref:Regulatory protein RecX n=1 Tax=Acetitomaculum ruminis DSM 5522 TaxID=1120918 RepID=A0A1I0VA42_9FIRM|nr:RecX family transcriptional regulator [Acetitomaculum ruminis]SFA73128.1 regulatory protein [Acetitomaculum ruminis DSM 5522]